MTDAPGKMNRHELQYLRDINKQLNGSIKQAVGDGMASRQLYCMQQLVASLIAERSNDQGAGQKTMTLCREQLPRLRELFAADDGGAQLVRDLADHCDKGAVQEVLADVARIASKLGARSDSASRRMLATLVDFDAARWLRVDEEVTGLTSSAGAAVDREAEPFNEEERARLVSLLQKQCGEGKDLSVTSVNALSGGFSKQTIMITLAGNRVLPGDIVVRRDRAESPVGSTVTDEFELLKSLHKAGLAVPQPFAAIDGGTVIGDPIMVVSRIEGRIIGDPYDIFDHKCPGVIPTLARQLARLHRIPLTSLTRALPGNDMSQREHLRGDIDEFRRHWRAEAESSIVIEAAFEWLDARFDQLPDTSRCITHRDMRFHNILVDDKGVSAILDWETATLGRPARDLGFVYRHITQLGDWQQFIDAYREAGGDAPAVAELDFYILWSDLLMTIWMYRARASYLGSGGGNIQLAFAGERMRQHNLRILSETMCNLLLKTQ